MEEIAQAGARARARVGVRARGVAVRAGGSWVARQRAAQWACVCVPIATTASRMNGECPARR